MRRCLSRRSLEHAARHRRAAFALIHAQAALAAAGNLRITDNPRRDS